MKKVLLLAFFFLSVKSFATTYYVSTSGSDANNGTSLASPFLTIPKAVSKVVAGDIIYIRGGNYAITAKINVNKSGTAANKIYMLAYPGDARPVINGSAMASGSGNRGLELSGSYWVIKGLDFYKAGDNGMHISGAFNIIEQCNFYENRDTGCQLANGANNNKIINCDSYYNRDSTSPTNKDGNADGFAVKLDVGTGNSFKGCRAWQNSDDGWDGLLSTGLGTNPSTTYDSCWCFMNGYYKSGTASIGNGNGFKMGGNNEQHDATLTRCLSAYNRVKGFDQNNNNGSMILYNCTGYKNKPNFGMNNNNPDAGKVMVVKNCISLSGGSSDVFRSVCVRSNNSWQSGVTTTTADFVAIDSIGLRSARKADGSLPDINFMHLVQGSDLIDAGVDVGLPYFGSNPDIGCFESNYPVPVKLSFYNVSLKEELTVKQIVNNWKTLTEVNTKIFNVQKSVNGKEFVTVGNVAARGASEYSFTDKISGNINLPAAIYYRLEIVDADGSKAYSETRQVQLKTTNTKLEVYPNPATDKIQLRFSNENQQAAQIFVYDAEGKIQQQVRTEVMNAGSCVKEVMTNKLPQGTYTVLVLFNKGTTVNAKLIKL